MSDWRETGFQYVELRSCGCAVGAIVEFDGPFQEFTAECIREAIERGNIVSRVPSKDVRITPCHHAQQ